MPSASVTPSADDQRRRWIGILAKADPARLEAAWAALDPPPGYRVLRAPEVGLAMVRGRIGGTGDPFNLGEMTMARAAVVTDSGHAGFGYVAGRDRRHAELAALFDALLLDPVRRPALLAALIDPLAAEAADRRAARSRAVQQSKVDFVTVVRGE